MTAIRFWSRVRHRTGMSTSTSFTPASALKDFDILNIQWADKTGVFVPIGGKLQSFKEIVDAIKAHPGEFSCGVVPGFRRIFQRRNSARGSETAAFGDPAGDLRSERPVAHRACRQPAGFRHGVARGEPEHAEPDQAGRGLQRCPGAGNCQTSRPLTRLLKPTMSRSNSVPSSMRALVTYADLREKIPGTTRQAPRTYEKLLHDPAFIAKAEKQGIATDWLGAEKSLEKIKAAYAIFDRHKALLTAQ